MHETVALNGAGIDLKNGPKVDLKKGHGASFSNIQINVTIVRLGGKVVWPRLLYNEY